MEWDLYSIVDGANMVSNLEATKNRARMEGGTKKKHGQGGGGQITNEKKQYNFGRDQETGPKKQNSADMTRKGRESHATRAGFIKKRECNVDYTVARKDSGPEFLCVGGRAVSKQKGKGSREGSASKSQKKFSRTKSRA